MNGNRAEPVQRPRSTELQDTATDTGEDGVKRTSAETQYHEPAEDGAVSYGLVRGDRIAIEHVYADLDARTDESWDIDRMVVATRESRVTAESPVAERAATAYNNGTVDIAYTPEFTAVALDDVYAIETAVDNS
jgi:hypothetical protein